MSKGKIIKVLVVDDSVVCRDLLVHIYESDPQFQVIGTAGNGQEALEFLKRNRPDVISMDVQMPKMDGFEATRAIMSTQPVPIVIVSSSWSHDEVAATFHAIEAGALALVGKPKAPGNPAHQAMAANLIQTVKAMSEVRVVRRWRRKPVTAFADPAVEQPALPADSAKRVRIVVIGVSTGGPPVLQAILSGLTPNFPVPIVIVQHIATGFLDGLRDWLTQSTGIAVHIASHGETPRPGQVHLAPDGSHLGFDAKGRFILSREEPDNGLRPSVAHLFRSTAEIFGDTAIGILLTGMGRDGADELKLMRDKGAITIVQDKESSIVHGMPGEAIALDAACHVLPPQGIAAMLTSLVTIPNPSPAVP